MCIKNNIKKKQVDGNKNEIEVILYVFVCLYAYKKKVYIVGGYVPFLGCYQINKKKKNEQHQKTKPIK
jgi:hypothetical protein